MSSSRCSTFHAHRGSSIVSSWAIRASSMASPPSGKADPLAGQVAELESLISCVTPDLSRLTEAEKDALILALWARVAELEVRLSAPPKSPGNSSLPPSKGHKENRPGRERRAGPRRGSLGRAGGGRPLAEEPDQFVIAKAAACAHCRAALGEADQVLHARYDKVELPP